MNYAIVIVTYNRLDKLKKCLSCALKQTVAANKIIVINNKSTDGTTDFLAEAKSIYKNLLVYDLEENTGGAGGFYYGLKETQFIDCDWILLIDDDAMMRSNFIEKINDRLNSSSKYLAFSGTVQTAEIKSLYHRKRLKKGLRYREIQVPENEYVGDFECDLASFCGLLVSVELVKKIGLPEKEFFIWYDDTEYCHRIRKETKILNVSSAILDHEVEENAYYMRKGNKMVWKDYYGLRNRIYTIKKHCNFFALQYEKAFYRLRIIKAFFMAKLKHNDNYLYNSHVISEALSDGLNGHLGRNSKYLPK